MLVYGGPQIRVERQREREFAGGKGKLKYRLLKGLEEAGAIYRPAAPLSDRERERGRRRQVVRDRAVRAREIR